MSLARQKNLRDPTRSRVPFENIFDDFFGQIEFSGSSLMDLGPGQWDFGVLAEKKGAKVSGIDNDPAVAKLGHHKGFDVIKGNLRNIERYVAKKFDGIFCKFSINAFWFWEDFRRIESFAEAIDSCLYEAGWAWIAPWNGRPKTVQLTLERSAQVLETQLNAFASLGYEVINLSESETRRYGLQGVVENHPIFVKHISLGNV